MTGNVVISEVNAFTYVINIKAEKHMPYEELGFTREMYNIVGEVSHNLSL